MVGDIVDNSQALKEADVLNIVAGDREVVSKTEMDTTSVSKEDKESYVGNTGILDSGSRTEFSTGAIRDIQDDKGDEYLLPFKETYEILAEYVTKYSGKSSKDAASINLFTKDVFLNLNEYKKTGNTTFLCAILNAIIAHEYEYDCPKAIMELAIHFKGGATKYAPRNWEKGMPVSNYISSFIRHFLKYIRGDKDEHHERAMMWNIICAIWTIRNLPELDDFYIKSSSSEEVSAKEESDNECG